MNFKLIVLWHLWLQYPWHLCIVQRSKILIPPRLKYWKIRYLMWQNAQKYTLVPVSLTFDWLILTVKPFVCMNFIILLWMRPLLHFVVTHGEGMYLQICLVFVCLFLCRFSWSANNFSLQMMPFSLELFCNRVNMFQRQFAMPKKKKIRRSNNSSVIVCDWQNSDRCYNSINTVVKIDMFPSLNVLMSTWFLPKEWNLNHKLKKSDFWFASKEIS